MRSTVQLAAVDVVVGSRASHKAADEIAVPVDIIPAEVIAQQGTSELSAILQNVSPSVNFPRQSVTDADDIVRPFTMRGLSPDHTLVLVNGVRRHRSALVHTFAFGEPAGATGVDLNAMPASAIERMEVLRDGASAQYGSEAIAGVLNLVIKDGQFAPFVNADFGRYMLKDYPDDGKTFNVNGGWGLKLGRGSLGLFAEYRNRQPTNRAWPEAADQIVRGRCRRGRRERQDHQEEQSRRAAEPSSRRRARERRAHVREPAPADQRRRARASCTGSAATRTASAPATASIARDCPSETGRDLPAGLPAGVPADGRGLVGGRPAFAASRTAGTTIGPASYGHNLFDYQLRQHAERVARPVPRRRRARRASTASSATPTIRASRTARTSSPAASAPASWD